MYCKEIVLGVFQKKKKKKKKEEEEEKDICIFPLRELSSLK